MLLERLRPVEAKLRYRLQKLLQLAGAPAAAADAAPDDLRHRPNLGALGGEEDEDEDDEGGGGGGGGGVYVPPKLAAVPYEAERGEGKRARQAEREARRASSSRLVRDARLGR